MRFQAQVSAVVSLALLVVACQGRTLEEFVNAEHFDDHTLLQTGKGVPRSHAVVAFYSPPCAKECDKFLTAEELNKMPPDHVLVVGRHDYVQRPQNTWYEWSSDYDLYSRLHGRATECLSIVFFPQGNQSDFQIWNKEGSLSEWLWKKSQIHINFDNHLDIPVKIHFLQGRRPIHMSTLESGKRSGMNAHFSHRFVVTTPEQLASEQRFINAYEIRFDMPSFNVKIERRTDGITTLKDWLEMTDRDLRDERTLRVKQWWSSTRRHLVNMKGPPLMPGFTPNGYKHVKMPTHVYDRLMQWYRDPVNIAARQVEQWDRAGNEINFDFVQTTMMHLPDQLKRWVASELKPLLEDWSKQPLDFQMMYGIREYHAGSMLMNHVDRMETHVVSVILNLDQEVAEPWRLHVIGFDGKKRKLAMAPGDLIMYESTKLIHGRPNPLNGTFYANAFLHYRPTDGWKGTFDYTADNVIVVGRQRVPVRPEHVLGQPWKPGDLDYWPASHENAPLNKHPRARQPADDAASGIQIGSHDEL